MLKQLKVLIAAMVFLAVPSFAVASDYIGDRECYVCHKDIKKVYMGDIHGKIFTNNPRNAQEEKGCEACHGAGAAHKDAADRIDKGEKVPLDVALPLKKGPEFTDENNKLCLTCHEKGTSTHWKGSEHEMADIACVDCHTIHSDEKVDGTESCTGCHVQKRAQMQRSSHIPIREGKVTCSDCHNPHGSAGLKLLRQPSINENCYSCHAEKRGPLLWEHAPVREDCSACHDSHGSNHPALLKMRVPYLCQSCHSTLLHPGTLYDGVDTAKNSMLLGKSCLNCHSLVHGSNHPSGSGFTR